MVYAFSIVLYMLKYKKNIENCTLCYLLCYFCAGFFRLLIKNK